MKPSFLALCAALLCSAPAFACKPYFRQVADYANGRVAYPVVFTGRVTSVEQEPAGPGAILWIRMEAIHRLSGGDPGSGAIVRGAIGSGAGTDCEGVFDFSAKVGEELLIFGELQEGKVHPDRHLSRPAPGGIVAPELLRQLARRRR